MVKLRSARQALAILAFHKIGQPGNGQYPTWNYIPKVTFVGHLNKVGKQLSSSVDNYNRAIGSLERKVLPGARKFVELGIHAKTKIEQLESIEAIPRSLVEPEGDNDEDPGDKTLQ